MRLIFIWSALLALPGLLWQSFEMYGLTIRGSQMLFFSIVHTSPVLVLVVMAALPLLLVVLVMAALGALRPSVRVRLGMSARALTILAAFLMFHFVLLVAYELWSPIDWLRVPLCTAGLVFLICALVSTLATLGSPASRVPAR